MKNNIKDENENENNNLSRRKFVKNVAFGTLGLAASLGLGKFAENAFGNENNNPDVKTVKSRIISVRSPGIMKDLRPDPNVVENMVNEGLKKLTGKDDITAAWSQFISKNDVVGIKVNPIGKKTLSSNPEVVNSIIKGIQGVGVKANNIIVWDRYDEHMGWAGYPFNKSSEGVRYYSTEPTSGYDREQFYKSDEDKESMRDEDGNISYFSNILTRDITALINVPVMKDHSIAGVTLCLKNISYGVVNNTRRFHAAPYYCDPMTAEVFSHPAVSKKIRLHILDSLNACFDGGPINMKPFTMWKEERILFGTDPVAIDKIGMELIEKKRLENNKSSIRHKAKHIRTAAQMGIGTDDPAMIDLVEVNV